MTTSRAMKGVRDIGVVGLHEGRDDGDGLAVSRRRARSLSFTLFEAMWWLRATIFKDFEAVLVPVIPNMKPD